MTTGIGCWLMIFCKNVRPSMPGISISRVMTSGTCFADAVGGDERVAGGSDHFNGGIGGEHLAQRLAYQRGIVDDEDSNSWRAHAVVPEFPLRDALSKASSRYTSTSPVPVWK